MGSATATPDAPPAAGGASEDELEKRRKEAAAGGGAEGGKTDAAEKPEGVKKHEGGKEAEAGKEKLEGEADDEKGISALTITAGGQLNLKVGGNEPDKATVKLRGGSIELGAGQMDKGEYGHLLVKVRCAEVHLVDKLDKSTGEVVGTERRHIIKIEGVEKVEAGG